MEVFNLGLLHSPTTASAAAPASRMPGLLIARGTASTSSTRMLVTAAPAPASPVGAPKPSSSRAAARKGPHANKSFEPVIPPHEAFLIITFGAFEDGAHGTGRKHKRAAPLILATGSSAGLDAVLLRKFLRLRPRCACASLAAARGADASILGSIGAPVDGDRDPARGRALRGKARAKRPFRRVPYSQRFPREYGGITPAPSLVVSNPPYLRAGSGNARS
jgi:hypothetical protein